MSDHTHGLSHDLSTLLQQVQARRQALRWLAGATALSLMGCGGGDDDSGSSGSGSGSGSGSSSGTSCAVIPEETAGPYPGDGSNANSNGVANALALSGIVRRDIRTSIAGATGVASGVPLTVVFDLVNVNGSCADLSGYAIYLWHCDAQGRYSMYSAGITGENYLRGVQETASDGTASFTTIVPGCYDGRVPHMHFEVYRSGTTATSYSNKLKTSQLCFPTAMTDAVYATSGYGSSASNAARISLSTDNVFGDGYSSQLATVTGNVTDGFVATLKVGISV